MKFNIKIVPPAMTGKVTVNMVYFSSALCGNFSRGDVVTGARRGVGMEGGGGAGKGAEEIVVGQAAGKAREQRGGQWGGREGRGRV